MTGADRSRRKDVEGRCGSTISILGVSAEEELRTAKENVMHGMWGAAQTDGIRRKTEAWKRAVHLQDRAHSQSEWGDPIHARRTHTE